jgi:hypothetical protein
MSQLLLVAIGRIHPSATRSRSRSIPVGSIPAQKIETPLSRRFDHGAETANPWAMARGTAQPATTGLISEPI